MNAKSIAKNNIFTKKYLKYCKKQIITPINQNKKLLKSETLLKNVNIKNDNKKYNSFVRLLILYKFSISVL